MNEDQLLHWIARSLDPGGRWIGDDAAFLPAGGEWAVSVDQQIAGTHFPEALPAAAIGRRLVAVNFSDLAASGARPAFCLLALAAPAEFDARALLRAAATRCEAAGARLVGGDLARADRCVASLTVLGRRRRGARWLRRSDGRAGDRLWLGGAVGESVAGRLLLARGARARGRAVAWPARVERELRAARLLTAATRAVTRHLLPEPQLDLGAWLARRRRSAAIDVSDGVALDLHRLCRASGVGAEIDAASLPYSASFARLAEWLGQPPLELALGGGEDYVLLFALPTDEAPPRRFGCSPIGWCTRASHLRLRVADELRPLSPVGWDHFAG